MAAAEEPGDPAAELPRHLGGRVDRGGALAPAEVRAELARWVPE